MLPAYVHVGGEGCITSYGLCQDGKRCVNLKLISYNAEPVLRNLRLGDRWERRNSSGSPRFDLSRSRRSRLCLHDAERDCCLAANSQTFCVHGHRTLKARLSFAWFEMRSSRHSNFTITRLSSRARWEVTLQAVCTKPGGAWCCRVHTMRAFRNSFPAEAVHLTRACAREQLR